MKRFAKLVLIAAVPVAIGGWALFRPELIFVDQKVNETLTTVSAMDRLAHGSFVSYAHETKGEAEVVRSGANLELRLKDFKTSNGPDVHVYLVKGSDASQDGVNKAGFLDLGVIKGNVGDQAYALPAGTDLKQYGGVAIWCKRFGVNFAGATLEMPKQARREMGFQLAAWDADVTVTSGPIKGQATGNAALTEGEGKRWVRLSGLKLPTGASVRALLVMDESPRTTAEIAKAKKIDLGPVTGKAARFPISDDVDAWLYRAVSLWDTKAKKSLGIALLRSAQEKHQALFTL